ERRQPLCQHGRGGQGGRTGGFRVEHVFVRHGGGGGGRGGGRVKKSCPFRRVRVRIEFSFGIGYQPLRPGRPHDVEIVPPLAIVTPGMAALSGTFVHKNSLVGQAAENFGPFGL
ncbi:hypothetical protein NGA_2120600, partial [Nannochloropsis gaditana CCMP526]|uniref:uncharacterized protein n=1 Tax=Nannochloropsis gaditana (strain CCMP526) TaxID=1093141 RepID=UPI00029F6C2B